jgi:hypothetical protein
MKYILYILIFFPSIFICQDFGVGTWREHLPYENIKYVAKMGNKYYGSTDYSVYYLDKDDNSLNRLNTITGLSELGVSLIHPNENNNTVVIGYKSGNIDLIIDDEIINISAILNSNIIGDKTIYSMASKDDLTYIATGFGIVVLDVRKQEISDTYIIGSSGSQIKINDITFANGYIYAASDNGIFYALESEPFLSDFTNWNILNCPLSSSNTFQVIEYFSEKNSLLIIEQNLQFNDDVVYVYKNNNWSILSQLASNDVYSIEHKDNNIIVSLNSNVLVLDTAFNTIDNIYTYNGSSSVSPNHCIWAEDTYLIADRKKGISSAIDNWKTENYTITGPYTNEAFHLECTNDKLWVSTGRTEGTTIWNNTYNWRGVYSFDSYNWTDYNRLTIAELNTDSISDYVWATINPQNDNHVFLSSFRGGLIELLDGNFVNRHTFYNSTLQKRIGHNGDNVNIAATSFDNNGNLWVSNSFVNEPLSVMTSDGTWLSFSCGASISNKLCTDLIVDDNYGYIWMSISGVGILVYNCNNTPLDDSDDSYKILTTSEGSGNLPSNEVNTIIEDRDGEIWVGTSRGPAVFYSAYNIFEGGDYDAQQILLNLDGSLQLLLETDNINEILIDGGNRKWFATSSGGLFLMSENGTEMLHSFNTSNSPLFSNNVISLAMNKVTGELYIATEDGIMGYKSEATEPKQVYSDIYAYPNPVRPEYTGNIAITGLKESSDVKIADASGNIVYSTTSIGGQATWNGKMLNGKRVSSGVYYIFVSDKDGMSKSKTKILFIN